MKTNSRFLFTAALGLALAFTFSCSTDSDLSPKSNESGPSSGTFEDIRDGKIYRWNKIGGQVWLENLNYARGGKCYGEGGPVALVDNGHIYDQITLTNAQIQNNCDRYGRLYDWVTAMALSSSCKTNRCSSLIFANHQGICPSGWHIPSNAEWAKLYHYVDGTNYVEGISGTEYKSLTAGKYLKATKGWDSNGNGIDTYGFTALPGGTGMESRDLGLDLLYASGGTYGRWHTSSEGNATSIFFWAIDYDSDAASWNTNLNKSDYFFSVRCVKN